MNVFGKKKGRIVFYVVVCSLGLAGVLSFVTFACAPIGFEGQSLMDEDSSASASSVLPSPIVEPSPVVTESVTPSVSPVSTLSSTPTFTPTPTPTRVSTPTPQPTPRPSPCTDIAISSQQFYFPVRGGSLQVLQVRGIPLGCDSVGYCGVSPGENFVTITRAGYIPPSPTNYDAYLSYPNPIKIDWFNFDWASNSKFNCSLNVDINMSVDDNSGGPRSLPLEVRAHLGTAQFLKTIVINQAGI